MGTQNHIWQIAMMIKSVTVFAAMLLLALFGMLQLLSADSAAANGRSLLRAGHRNKEFYNVKSSSSSSSSSSSASSSSDSSVPKKITHVLESSITSSVEFEPIPRKQASRKFKHGEPVVDRKYFEKRNVE